MIVFNERELNDLLQHISSGFRSNLVQIILFFSFVAGVAILFVIIHLLQKRREQRRIEVARRSRFDALAAKREVTPAERRLLDRLVGYLPEPSRASVLLSNPRSFEKALVALQAAEAADASVVRSLREKVTAGAGRSRSRSLPGDGGMQRRRFFRSRLGIRVRLKRPDGEVVAAELMDLSGGGARIRIPGEPLDPGTPVAVALPVGSGKPLVVRARVVRMAAVRGIASLAFVGLRSGDEDRIISFVNRLGTKEG